MASERQGELSEYPRPWFYRPEIYYGFIIFPPVWSVLTLRSPWHGGEGTRSILVGGVAWFFIIASVVLSVRWVQEGGVIKLFVFVPGVLLTLLTQVQWTAHRARHGAPPTDLEDAPQTAAPAPPMETALSGSAKHDEDGDGAAPAQDDEPGDGQSAPDSNAPRRRRRRRRRPISRSADSATLC